MIGTIRKHSALLWWTIIPITIISFVFFMGQGGMHNNTGRNGGYGTIYGKPVTTEAFDAAQREFFIYYWQQRHVFPDKDPNMTHLELERETYVRLLLTGKARELGIHVSDEAQAIAANDVLAMVGRSLSRNGQPVPMSQFVQYVLEPEGLTAADFQRFVTDDLIIQQLVESFGVSGALLSPQEASQLYDHAHQDVSAQAVFFSATNYMSQITANPAAVSIFYTNYMAHYVLPDRVQVNYVEYDLTNFLAAAEQSAGKTNIANQADAYFAQHGLDSVPGAKTPEEAKAKIGEMILRQDAAKAAADQARQFVTPLFAMDPVSPDNFVVLAKKMGLTVHTTAPFSEAEGPDEFAAPTELTKTAFKLNADSPFSKPIAGAEAVYVIGLAQTLPSTIQPFDQVQDRVIADYKFYQGAMMARNAGTNFYFSTTVQMRLGKTFAQAALAAGQSPVALQPFSLSSQAVPEAEGHAEMDQLKNAAFSTEIGHISQFVATSDGGFVLFVESLLPINEASKTTELPNFVSQVRRNRENEAFNVWLQGEVNHELRSTRLFDDLAAGKTPAQQSVNTTVKLSSPATREFWEIPVLFEDEHWLALDKPAGLLTSPDHAAPERPSLMHLLHAGVEAGKPWARERNLTYLANAHRLDFETSGVLLLAKNKPALVALADQFGSLKPVRKYIALVQGVPPGESMVMDEKIGPHPLKNGLMRIDSKNGKKSKTEVAVVEKFSRWSLLRCTPLMERAQQILLHLDHAGFPVVGDEAHGGKKLWLSRLKKDFYLKPGRDERPLISRAALHAEELILEHPATHETVSIKSEWPKDLRVALKYLRQYATGA